MPLPHNVQPPQTAGVARNLGLVELTGAGEYAVYAHPRVPEMITLLPRRWSVPASDLKEQFDAIGISEDEVESAFDRLP